MAKSNSIQNNGWGGDWTEQKLDCFESYVRAYLTIMNSYRDAYKWKLIYFDGFAGSGNRTIEDQQQEAKSINSLFGDDLVADQDITVYEGAAERIVKLETPDFRGFDYYYFIDQFEENCTRLELKLSQYPTKGTKQFRPGDANAVTLQLAKAMKNNARLKTLCFLDPFGMSIDWDTIVAIAGKSIDLWILVPTGVIINRLLKRDGELLHPERLAQFFGMNEAQIKDYFYTKTIEASLFDEEPIEQFHKKENTINKIAQLYCERLGELFPYVTNSPLVLRNSNNVPIYHFVCASHNQTAVKIAQQIITKRQK